MDDQEVTSVAQKATLGGEALQKRRWVSSEASSQLNNARASLLVEFGNDLGSRYSVDIGNDNLGTLFEKMCGDAESDTASAACRTTQERKTSEEGGRSLGVA